MVNTVDPEQVQREKCNGISCSIQIIVIEVDQTGERCTFTCGLGHNDEERQRECFVE